MSSVHPSRAGLVPQDRPTAAQYHDRDRNGTQQQQQRRDGGDRRQSRSPQRAPADARYRRPSPSYDSYRGGSAGRAADYDDRARPAGGYGEDDEEQRRREAWMRGDDIRRNGGGRRLTPERELASRHGDGPSRGYGRGPPPQRGGGADFFEARRKERDNSTVTIWAESPRSPQRSPSPEGRKSSSGKHKSSRRRRDYSSSSSDSDSDDSRRRSSKKHRSSSSRKHRHEKSSRHRSSRKYSDDDGDSEDDRRHRRHHSSHKDRSDDERDAHKKGDYHSSSRRRSESRDVESSSKAVARREDHGGADEDEWVEKPSAVTLDDAEEVGPMPVNMQNQKMGRNAYGGALLRGEGDAMAAYVQEGARIPRRGEIGLDSEQIERYESAGYVMSGSRHRRMNAVRVRKENQVISAEEKRGILKLQAEEKAKRENEIVASFREMVSQKLSGPGGGGSGGS
ncbi:hypothetical protein OIV83_002280 [Microbotryomycetes sp. JL201]|nr:hypothetical protein OIV83_002280 [Microbotryomycetes sp. JL201]